MRSVRVVFALVILAIGSVLAALLLAPGSVVRPLANYLLSDYSGEITSIEQLRLGWRDSSVAAVRLRLAGMDLLFDGLTVTYRPRDLISQGQVVAVAVDRLEVAVNATFGNGEQPSTPLPTLADVMAMMETLPFSEFSVTDFAVRGAINATGAVTARTRPLGLEAELGSDAWPDWRGELSLQQTGNTGITGTVNFAQRQQSVVTGEWSLQQTETNLEVQLTSEINLQTLQDLPPVASAIGPVRLLDTSLQVRAELQVPVEFASGPVALTSVDFNTADGAMSWLWTAPAGTVDGELAMPVTLTGAVDTQANNLSLSLNAVQANLTMASELFTGDAGLEVSDVQLACDFQAQCDSTLLAELHLPVWKFAEVSGENALLGGALEVTQGGTGLALRAPNLELQLPRFQHETGAGSGALLLQDLEVLAADRLQVSVRGSTRALDLDLAELELVNPALSAELELAANQLRGTAHISLNERFRTSLVFRHDLETETGDMDVTLEPLQFSDANPFSSLVRFPDLDADLVAGTVSGGGELAWQRSTSGWQISGPVALDLEQLSGFVADVFFIGFNSSPQARLEDGNLFSEDLQTASISTLDVGLPMNRIDWQYGFDLSAGTLSIDSLRTGMLGGTVEIPAFVFDSSAEENRLRVVLSNLDLADIVDLANYPNLQVVGTVSGYLPLLITSDGVTLEEGLVSALNPGGSIRYTPATGNSSNASVQLLNDALSNFLFETLNAELQYSANGDLDMAVQLRGVNPDMRGGQPINLNVTIADNIPTLLRSLQAGRVITERLEERLNRQ